MKQSIIILISILITHALSLNAMDINNEEQTLSTSLSTTSYGYGALTKNIFHSIEQQRHAVSRASHEPVSSLSLKKMNSRFYHMSDECKDNAMKKISARSKILSLLYGMVMTLPPEIVKNICLLMMDGEYDPNLSEEESKEWRKTIQESANALYSQPFLSAFEVYHEIKTTQADSKRPIGLMYFKYQKDRELIRELKNLSFPVTRSHYNHILDEKINLLDSDIKNTFLQGKNINVLPGWSYHENIKNCLQSGGTFAVPLCLCGMVLSTTGSCINVSALKALGAAGLSCGCLSSCVTSIFYGFLLKKETEQITL